MKQALVAQVISREQENSHLESPDHTLHTLHNAYNLGPSPLLQYPWGQVRSRHCNQIPRLQYRHQQPKNIKSKIPSTFRTVICQDMGKFWSQVLTRSMERGPIAAVPSPVLREESQPWFSQARATHIGRGSSALKETS